ncbi:MAG: hypothetical protein ACD_3C00220G0002 [uncultured bacterium (gcode 4)]|uniref:Uncharacterized protein n=1 Tax=uncultured bacterium (gcode 4) TaxID=1234023 RepID=K2F856_9BACT|nr:MAG: hypothetical protein ACD_3C00220G0002 [uncultured bacterium (gcode 4)]
MPICMKNAPKNFTSIDVRLKDTSISFIDELRAFVGKILSTPQAQIAKIENSTVFKVTDIAWITRKYEHDILKIINDARESSLRTLYLRWTSLKNLESSIQSWLISKKLVDDFFENDVGTVACYKIPTYVTNIQNDEFLFRFFMTVLSSVRYAFNHPFWWDMSLILFSPKIPTEWDLEDIRLAIEWVPFNLPVFSAHERECLQISDLNIPLFKENTWKGIMNSLDLNEWLILNITREEFYDLRKNILIEKEKLNKRWILNWESNMAVFQYIISEHFFFQILDNISSRFWGYKDCFLKKYWTEF